MYVILLKFTGDKAEAARHMDGHNHWLKQGFDDGVFALAGSLQSPAGGCILAKGETLEAIQSRVSADPFVEYGIVSPEVLQVTPGKLDPRLDFFQ